MNFGRRRLFVVLLMLIAACKTTSSEDGEMSRADNQVIRSDRGPCLVTFENYQLELRVPKQFWDNRGRYRGQIPSEEEAPDAYSRNYGSAFLTQLEARISKKIDGKWTLVQGNSELRPGFLQVTSRFGEVDGAKFRIELFPDQTPFAVEVTLDDGGRRRLEKFKCPRWDDPQ